MTSKDPQGEAMFGYLSGLCEPLGICDFGTHVASTGMPGLESVIGPFMAARIRAGNSHLGNIFIAREPGGQEFTSEDEETLEMFANQVAMAVTNARRYGEDSATTPGTLPTSSRSPAPATARAPLGPDRAPSDLFTLILERARTSPGASQSVDALRRRCRCPSEGD